MAIYFITGSKDKLLEIKSVLGDVEQLEIDLPEIQSLNAREIIEEKLKEARKHHLGEFIVEDTSLYFSALNGLPGPFVKWFLKAIGNEGLYKIVKTFGNSQAEVKTIIGYASAEGEIKFFEGNFTGTIVEPRGNNGFGWDSIFQPNGTNKTFAELTTGEKNSFSMRKIAAEKLKEYLGRF